jgi:hypothetical protein
MKMPGSGILLSSSFTPGSGPMTVPYSFDCSSLGWPGTFTAHMIGRPPPWLLLLAVHCWNPAQR